MNPFQPLLKRDINESSGAVPNEEEPARNSIRYFFKFKISLYNLIHAQNKFTYTKYEYVVLLKSLTK